MRALVVVESMFGNTRRVADAIAEGLAIHAQTTVTDVGDAPTSLGGQVDLLVIGGPTHAFGLSRSGTRRDAARQAPEIQVPTGTGVREWLDALRPGALAGAAAFDTRISRPRIPGSAARATERRLRRLGVPVTAPAMSFFVVGTRGPLVDGELGRARLWGERLATAFTATEQPDR